MRNRLTVVLGALVLWAASTGAHAAYVSATWTDVVTQQQKLSSSLFDQLWYGIPGSHTWTHDITDSGFTPFHDIAESFTLGIQIYDDGDAGDEEALIWLPLTLPESSGPSYFEISGDDLGGWAIGSLLELNALGLLTVTVTALKGDFWVGNSYLTVNGLKNVVGVVEPATFALFGLGLAAAGLATRRRRNSPV